MQIEATGKSVDIAIQNGLLECGMRREDVDVKVLGEGGLFKKAKVILSWGEKSNDENPDFESDLVSKNAENSQLGSIKLEENDAQIELDNEQTETAKQKTKKIVDSTRLEASCKEFLTGLIKFVDENAKIVCQKGDNELSFSIEGDNLKKLIGYHGENIQALQLLLSGLKRRHEGAIRIFVDVDGYKFNRNQAIVELANKTAEQAIKIERNIHLDPMNAYERRIVHTTLQDRDDVTTESTGEGEKRHVVVKPLFRK